MNENENKILNKISDISNNNTLQAMRNALMYLIPFLLISGLSTFIGAVALAEGTPIANALPADLAINLRELFGRIGTGTVNLMSVMLAVLVPYFIGKQKNFKNPIMLGMVSLGLFFVCSPIEGASTYFGSKGMLISMVISITSAHWFIHLSKNEKLKINMGNNVPEAITNSFNSLLIVVIEFVVYAVIAQLIKGLFGMEIIELFTEVLQKPLMGINASLFGCILYVLICGILWSFGIHPSAILSPLMAALTAAVAEGYAMNYSFVLTYGMIGGTGSLAGLLICLLISKRKEFKTLGKMCFIPELFNITEPLTFGLPIVYNLTLCIPFTVIPIFNLIVAYIALKAGLIGKMTTQLTWSVPILMKGYLGSNGDIRNVILEAVLLIVDTFIWKIFVSAYEKNLVKENVSK